LALNEILYLFLDAMIFDGCAIFAEFP